MKLAQSIERLLPLLLFFTTLATSYFWWRSEHRYEAALQRINALQKERSAPSTPPAQQPPEPAKPEIQTRVLKVPTVTESPESLRTIQELRSRLAELTAEIQKLEEAKAGAETAHAESRKKLEVQLAETRDLLEPLRRSNAALEAELKFKNERLARLESAPAAKPVAAAPPPKPAAPNGEEVERNRRREALLASLQRRYREVTDLYRSFTLRQPDMQAGDLSRIQSSIQMAEDELRQLQALNAPPRRK